MSPKRNVLKRYPDAYCVRALDRSVSKPVFLVMPVKELGRPCLATGPTARAAWAAAERALKGAR